MLTTNPLTREGFAYEDLLEVWRKEERARATYPPFSDGDFQDPIPIETRVGLAAPYYAITDRERSVVANYVDALDLDHDKPTPAGASWHDRVVHPFCPSCLARTIAVLHDDEVAIPAAREEVRNRAALYLLKHRQFPEDAFDPEAESEQVYFNLDELEELEVPPPLIRSTLHANTYAILRGRDASFKSFVALDWGLCVASGKRWQGYDVQQGKVLYIAGEGAYGLRRRITAWRSAWKVEVPPSHFVVRISAVNMAKRTAQFAELEELCRTERFSLIVVDTLRRASGGADENSSDMGVVVDNLDRLRRASGGTVVAVAHTGKDDRDARGFSGIEDDADTVWHVKRQEGSSAFSMTCTKMKDGDDGQALSLLAKESNGSLIIEHHMADEEEPGRESARSVLHALRTTFKETGATVPELVSYTALSRSIIYDARAALLKDDLILLDGSRLRAASGTPDTDSGVSDGPSDTDSDMSETRPTSQTPLDYGLSDPSDSCPTSGVPVSDVSDPPLGVGHRTDSDSGSEKR